MRSEIIRHQITCEMSVSVASQVRVRSSKPLTKLQLLGNPAKSLRGGEMRELMLTDGAGSSAILRLDSTRCMAGCML